MTATSTTGQTTADRRTVVGVFDGPNHAEQALNELKNSGFAPEQVSVVAKDNRETQQMVEETGMGAEGAASGAVLGGLTGGIVGWLVGISGLAIPGIGPIVGAGVLATALAGAGIGAVAGGLIGALVDQGVPEEEARGYEESVRRGSILLTVHAQTDEQAHRAHEIFDRHGGADVRSYGVAARSSGLAGHDRTTGTHADQPLAGRERDVIASEELRDDRGQHPS